MKSDKDINNIYRKYLDKTASKEEVEMFLKWVNEHNNPNFLLKEMEKNWDTSNTNFKGSWKEIEQKADLSKENTAGKTPSRKIHSLNYLKYAAAIVIPIVAVLSIWKFTSQQDIIYTTDYGKTQTIELPDGSQVILNANSKITWSGNWEKANARRVTLEGEAFFDVMQISTEGAAKIPFDVITEDITVKVLGTSFNVSSRAEEINVYLESGKVELDFKNRELDNEKMTPGESVNYSKINGKLSRQKSSLVESASWKDGSFIYKEERLARVLKDIKNNYGKDIMVKDPKLLEKKVTVGLPYSDWEMVVESLELMLDLKLINTNDEIILE